MPPAPGSSPCSCWPRSAAQTEYIENQLKHCTARWKIITCHHSVFAPAKGRNFQFARDHWRPLLDRYGVDLVLNGHDHTYARGHVPMRTADGQDTDDLSTVYVTSASGPKQYQLDLEQLKSYEAEGYRLKKSAEQTQFFQVISIDDDTLTYVAYTALGKEYDRAVIKKDFESGRKQLSTGDDLPHAEECEENTEQPKSTPRRSVPVSVNRL